MEFTKQVYLLERPKGVKDDVKHARMAASKTSIVLRKYLLDIVFQGKRKIMSPCRKLTLTWGYLCSSQLNSPAFYAKQDFHRENSLFTSSAPPLSNNLKQA